jgi:general secretion pathway protein B
MSYILDALRRAEAERERGAVPGLNAQPFNPAVAKRRGSSQQRRAMMIGIGVLLLVAIAVGLYFGFHDASGSAPPSAAVVAQPRAAEPAMPAATPAPVVVTPAPATTVATPSTSSPAAPPVIAQAPRARPSYIDAPPPEPKAVARKLPAASPDASAPAPAADARIYKFGELPDNIRAELPKLALGGSMYSDSPAARMVIVNGQVLHEHDAITSELSLDHITTKAAVFSYKGYKYEMPF